MPEPRHEMLVPASQPSPAAGSAARLEASEAVAPPAPPAGAGPSLPDGTHQVRFADNSAYYGEWHAGSMHGRGVFLWPAGARYEGEWQHGKEEGTGAFFVPGRGTYYGSWRDGQMHGKCVYTPAAGPAAGEAAEAGASVTPPGRVVFLQRYDRGQLVAEQVLRVAQKDVRKKQQKKEGKKKAKREAKQLQAFHTPKPGEAVYKGHWSYILMRQLQLGITFCIAQAGLAAAAGAPLGERDFREETTQHFPPGAETPPFKWKDYAPRVFQRLREQFGIDNSDYLLSLTGDAALRLLGSPGKSGSVFFLSDDDRFLVKTVRKEEMRLLLELIPRYFRHMGANPGTLLVRCYGVHRISPLLGRRVRFIVMGNVLPSDLRMHRRYDLKGSTHGRTAGERQRRDNPFATLKDCDVDMQLVLPAKQHDAVLRQLQRDLELLGRLRVIDYSLLLGVHFLRWGNGAWHPPFADWPAQPAGAAAAEEAQGAASGSAEGTAPASPTSGGDAAEAAAAGEGVARCSAEQQSLALALRATPAVMGAATSVHDTVAPRTDRIASAAAALEPTPTRVLSGFHRSTSIDAANSLAALIAASVQPPVRQGVLQARQQAEQQAEQLEQQTAESQEEQRAEQRAEQQAALQQWRLHGQREVADGVPTLEVKGLSAAAAANLMQTANLSRAQARLSARAALQAANNGDGVAAAVELVPIAGLPPLPPLPPIAEATETGNVPSAEALRRSASSSTSSSNGSSRLVDASTRSMHGSGASSYLSADSGPGPPVSAGLAAQLEAAAEAALAHNGGQGPVIRTFAADEQEQQQHQPQQAAAWWPDVMCGLGGAAVCLAGGPTGTASEGSEERWARHPPQPALPLSPHELAAGMGVQQAQRAQQAQQEQAQAERCFVLDSRATSVSQVGTSFSSRPTSVLEEPAGQMQAATAAGCTALKQQQDKLGRLLSSRSSGDEVGSLGRAVPAVAVRRGSGGELQCEPVLLYFGVIDFLQDYTLRKHLEQWTKAAVWGGQAVSVAAPGSYSRRFLAAMQRVLVSSEAMEAGLGCSGCNSGSGGKGAG